MSEPAVVLDPGAWLAFVDGPLHGQIIEPVPCECETCARSGAPHPT